MSTVEPFRLAVPQADLDDLQDRLARTRWADELPETEVTDGVRRGPIAPGWEYGVPSAYVRPLAEYWRTGFDWRAQEARINGYPQFTTEIDGQNVHFFHVRSPEPGAVPLLLTHGWPNTSFEYLGLIDRLSDPRAHGGDAADAFHLVIPTIPGFGLSGPTTRKGWNEYRVARAWAELMRRLDYDRYAVHGNDGGAIVSPVLGRLDPDRVIGVHVNQIFSFPSGDPAEFADLAPAELEYLEFLQAFVGHSVHDKVQRAQPQTIAHALADSPVGQLAWSGQLFGDALTPDEVLTNVSLYWFTNTAASAARFYYECALTEPEAEPTTVPIGLASFVNDFRPIRRLAERDHSNIVHWNEFDRGGHWAAHDAPDLLIEDIREFFHKLR
ncbi:epoxide hydrolase family protein [Actinomadura mexicana]|uniref:Pimeloyl-ACP methyl ester carboxylesterase n=1 Tax=Actinomadura mexicana TaxID=134959 RepID=A0A238WQU6_9ACTN|nr:epoxide hydrolase family protein [Actinomadura mexicana]SNR48703.1 Pimeloyl-ACP methyl ester carboxylesterase [Actinomadura mexicana]